MSELSSGLLAFISSMESPWSSCGKYLILLERGCKSSRCGLKACASTAPVLFQCCSNTFPVLFQYCTSTTPIQFQYCFSTTAPVLFQRSSNTIPVLHQYCSSTISVLSQYSSILWVWGCCRTIGCRDPFLGSAVDGTACWKHTSTKKNVGRHNQHFEIWPPRPETHSRKSSRMCRAPFFAGWLRGPFSEILERFSGRELFQYCFSIGPILFQYCTSISVSVLFQYCSSTAPVLFQCCSNTIEYVPIRFQYCFSAVPMTSHWFSGKCWFQEAAPTLVIDFCIGFLKKMLIALGSAYSSNWLFALFFLGKMLIPRGGAYS